MSSPPPFLLHPTLLLLLFFPSSKSFVVSGHRAMIVLPSIPHPDFAIDLATLSLISVLLLLSFLSLCLIFYFKFKTHNSYYLQSFNALWTVRFLLVLFIILWSLTEALRLPFFRKHYIYPFFEDLTLGQQASLCKLHLVLSLGLLEPGFLVTLLFLLLVSIKKRTPRGSWAFLFLLATCLPLSSLQFLFVFFQSSRSEFPCWFRRSSVIVRDGSHSRIVLCSSPFLSISLFGAFAAVYGLYFLFSCWSVVSLVINKKLRVRTYTLALTVLIAVTLQVLFLVLSLFWEPGELTFGVVEFIEFLSTFTCATVGQGILVIIPIVDSLAVGGDCCRWYPIITQTKTEEESKEESV